MNNTPPPMGIITMFYEKKITNFIKTTKSIFMQTIVNTLKKSSFIFLAVVLLGLTHIYAQQKKYELKDNSFYTNGKAQFTIEEMNSSIMKGEKDVILKNVKGQRLILFELRENAAKTKYFEVHFLTNNTTAEWKLADLTSLGQTVAESQLVVDGDVNNDAAKKFVAANTNKFSNTTKSK